MLVVPYIVGAFVIVMGVPNAPADITVFSAIVAEITMGRPLILVTNVRSTTSCVRQAFSRLTAYLGDHADTAMGST